jgi:hypothetical protein
VSLAPLVRTPPFPVLKANPALLALIQLFLAPKVNQVFRALLARLLFLLTQATAQLWTLMG